MTVYKTLAFKSVKDNSKNQINNNKVVSRFSYLTGKKTGN